MRPRPDYQHARRAWRADVLPVRARLLRFRRPIDHPVCYSRAHLGANRAAHVSSDSHADGATHRRADAIANCAANRGADGTTHCSTDTIANRAASSSADDTTHRGASTRIAGCIASKTAGGTTHHRANGTCATTCRAATAARIGAQSAAHSTADWQWQYTLSR